jgi:hypothetical protein
MTYLGWLILLGVGSSSSLLARELIEVEYRLLATSRTSTMERELNEAALDGFVLDRAMGGETAHGGQELVAILSRELDGDRMVPAEYIVLATNRTGTTQDELNDAARRGFFFVAQTVFDTSFSGEEVVVIMERGSADGPVCEYQVLATERTSTMAKELAESARRGFVVLGLSVSETAFGGNEVVVVTERCVSP